MRLARITLVFGCILSAVHAGAPLGAALKQRRAVASQDTPLPSSDVATPTKPAGPSTTALSSSDATTSASQAASETGTGTGASEKSTSLDHSSKSASHTSPSHTSSHSSTSTIVSSTAIPKNDTQYLDNGELPIAPQITPAFGVAGIILLLSGLVYTAVGVRSQWMQIFLSAAYLSALAITVLVLYVATPPISDAVQGAYFVAACVPSLIVGGLALIFPEVARGLGCLLGGFCLSMWFLVLKSGGLVTSTGGRVALIASLSAAAFALSFSHYTRVYGLMVCTSFAGATIVVLGIDCFSRAGLKEFWVYLWDLNASLFPLDTNTYPLTRGIKAEIAVIIVLFLCGLLSQWKLWKILDERRKQKASDRAQDAEGREHLEADLGRRIEDMNVRDRAQWETIYGNKNSTTITSSYSGTVHSTSEGSRPSSIKEANGQGFVRDMMLGGHEAVELIPLEQGKRSSQHSIVSQGDAKSSMAAVAAGNVVSYTDYRPVVGPGFGRESNERKSMIRGVSNSFTAVPALDIEPMPFSIGHLDDQTDASSVAATLDDLTDDNASLPDMSQPESPSKRLSTKNPFGKLPLRRVGSMSKLISSEKRMSSAPEKESFNHNRRNSEPSQQAVLEALKNDNDLMEMQKSSEPSKLLGLTTLPSETTSGKPDKSARSSRQESLPRVATMYRTFEWQKYLDVADRPDLEDLHPSADGTVVNRLSREVPAHVNVEGLQQTATGEGFQRRGDDARWTGHDSRRVSQSASKNPFRRSSGGVSTEALSREGVYPVDRSNLHAQKPGQLARSASAQGVFTRNLASRPSTQVLQRSSSAQLGRPPSQATLQTQNLRSFSNPLLSQTLVESPIEDEAESAESSMVTLLGQRESRLRGKLSTMSFNDLPLQTSLPSAYSSVLPGTVYSPTHYEDDEDNVSLSSRKQMIAEENMSLAQRRQLMQQQLPRSRSQSRQDTWPANRSSIQVPYDAHPPKRSNTTNPATRESRMAAWRQSMQNTTATVSQSQVMRDEERRNVMLREKRQSQAMKHLKQHETQARDSIFDTRMRQGDMLHLHREKLRQMQNNAEAKATL